MQGQRASSVQNGVVLSERVARALIESVLTDELGPFRQGPLSPNELAGQTGEPIYRALRRIHKWEALGILQVHSVERRAGRPIRRYALTSDNFYIPASVLPHAEVSKIVSGPMEHQMQTNVTHVLLDLIGIQGSQVFLEPVRYGAFLVRERGEIWNGLGENQPVIADQWAKLQLSYADARAMRDELDVVFTRYASRQGPQTYWMHLRLVPERGKP